LEGDKQAVVMIVVFLLKLHVGKMETIGFQIMFLARLEGAPLSKAYK
jgi:hypothetical protein